jgi:hypothetical protein
MGGRKQRRRYTATNPDRVTEKVRECRFFALQMAEYEKAKDIEKFIYCLSAFLCAFRTIVGRLIGVVETVSGKESKKKLWSRLQSERDIWFLKDVTDLEVHGDGPTVWPKYTVHVLSSVRESHYRGRPRQRFASRFEGRFHPRVESQHVDVQIENWQFEGHPKNLIELCRDSLGELEAIVRKELPGTATKVLSTGPG